MSRLTIRKFQNSLFAAMTGMAALLGLFFLAAILTTLVWKGGQGLSLAVFTETTPPPGEAGGLLNPILGSIVMTLLATLIGAPIGIMAGIYMVEYDRNSMITNSVRTTCSVLLSAPSIIIGIFIYEIVVAPMGGFSAFAGTLALSVIMFPIIVKITEDMLLLVPDQLREAAFALGLSRDVVIRKICCRAAKAGILTGVVIALARISGETAPLLFTSLNNQFMNYALDQPMASLPVTIFQFAISPYEEWRQLAWTGSLLIAISFLLISALARMGLKQNNR